MPIILEKELRANFLVRQPHYNPNIRGQCANRQTAPGLTEYGELQCVLVSVFGWAKPRAGLEGFAEMKLILEADLSADSGNRKSGIHEHGFGGTHTQIF